MINFILLFIYISIGFVLKKSKLPVQNLHLKLNKFIISIALPAMVLLETPKLEFSMDNMIPVYIAWATMIGSAFLVLLASKRYHFNKNVTACLMLVSVLTNSTFVGIPVITVYYGAESLPFIVLYDQLGTSFWLATYATIIVAYYSNHETVSFTSITKKVLRFPPFIAFAFAVLFSLFFSEYSYPDLMTKALEIITLTIVPCALISVGLQLQFKLDTNEIKPFTVSLVIKLILSPLIAIVISYMFGWSDLLTAKVSIMESAMPAMITAGLIASINGFAPRLSNAIVAYGIAISLVSSWLVYLIIN